MLVWKVWEIRSLLILSCMSCFLAVLVDCPIHLLKFHFILIQKVVASALTFKVNLWRRMFAWGQSIACEPIFNARVSPTTNRYKQVCKSKDERRNQNARRKGRWKKPTGLFNARLFASCKKRERKEVQGELRSYEATVQVQVLGRPTMVDMFSEAKDD